MRQSGTAGLPGKLYGHSIITDMILGSEVNQYEEQQSSTQNWYAWRSESRASRKHIQIETSCTGNMEMALGKKEIEGKHKHALFPSHPITWDGGTS